MKSDIIIIIIKKDDDLNNDPRFSHHQGMDRRKERQHWEDMFDSQKILKSVKSKSTVSSKMLILLKTTTNIFKRLHKFLIVFFLYLFL